MVWLALLTTAKDWLEAIAAISLVLGVMGWSIYRSFFAEKTEDDAKLAKTRAEIITAYETRIKQLEENHEDNQKRIAALEQTVRDQSAAMEALYSKNKELVDLLAGRDPAIQEFLTRGGTAIDTFTKHTAPQVHDLHKHFFKKP